MRCWGLDPLRLGIQAGFVSETACSSLSTRVEIVGGESEGQ